MYQPNGHMHTLAITRERLATPTVINRIRRVVREEISCGDCFELQSIRFDLHIVRPLNYTSKAANRHMAVVQRSLEYMLKGNSIDFPIH